MYKEKKKVEEPFAWLHEKLDYTNRSELLKFAKRVYFETPENERLKTLQILSSRVSEAFEKLLFLELEDEYTTFKRYESTLKEMFLLLGLEHEIVPINSKRTLSTSIAPQFRGLDLVMIYTMAKKLRRSQHKEQDLEKDIALIRTIIEKFIARNNKDSEVALSENSESVEKILLHYASLEQEILSFYKLMVTYYFTFSDEPFNKKLAQKPFTTYFDNYFADFDEALEYYRLYPDTSVSNITQSAYYTKIYNATEGKLHNIRLSYLRRFEQLKRNYIKDRNILTELTLLQEETDLEVMNLIEEFSRYGSIFIKQLQGEKEELDTHYQNISTLRDRFSTKEKNGTL